MSNMNKRNFTLRAAGLAASISVFGSAAFALSAIVEDAKNQCVVGEQADGYLGFVNGADGSDELRREVRDINQARKAQYSDIAKRNGVSVDVTATITAQKLIDQSSAGQCVRDQSGQWIEL